MVKDLQPLATTLDLHACDIEKATAAGQLWLCKRVQEALQMLYGWCNLHYTVYLSWPLLWEAACSIRLHMILGQLLLNYNAVHFYDFVYMYIFVDHHMSDRNIVML